MGDEPVVGVVPNFSEGRDAGVIAAIVSALHVPGARVVYAERRDDRVDHPGVPSLAEVRHDADHGLIPHGAKDTALAIPDAGPRDSGR